MQYRGKGALQEQKLETEMRKTKTGRGGTAGEGTRQATQRSHAEECAYHFDLSGWQEHSLRCALITYMDESSRAAVCATPNGQHANGLILKRTKASAACSLIKCSCAADTSAMAQFLGCGKDPYHTVWLAAPFEHQVLAMLALTAPCPRVRAQVSKWWSQNKTKLERRRLSSAPIDGAAMRSPTPRKRGREEDDLAAAEGRAPSWAEVGLASPAA